MRSKIRAKSFLGTVTSSSWETLYIACDTTFAPILASFSGKVVGCHLRIDLSSAHCCREFARSYASPVARSPNTLDRAVDTSGAEAHAPQNMMDNVDVSVALLPCLRLSDAPPGVSIPRSIRPTQFMSGLTDARKSIKHRHRCAFGSSITWGRFRQMLGRNPLPLPKLSHAVYGRLRSRWLEEPDASIAHVRAPRVGNCPGPAGGG
jgi:hypothetical protein